MIKVEIITPDHLVTSVEAYLCILPGTEGKLGILEGHEPMAISLMAGEIVLHLSEENHIRPDSIKRWKIDGGLAIVGGKNCVITVLECEEN